MKKTFYNLFLFGTTFSSVDNNTNSLWHTDAHNVDETNIRTHNTQPHTHAHIEETNIYIHKHNIE